MIVDTSQNVCVHCGRPCGNDTGLTVCCDARYIELQDERQQPIGVRLHTAARRRPRGSRDHVPGAVMKISVFDCLDKHEACRHGTVPRTDCARVCGRCGDRCPEHGKNHHPMGARCWACAKCPRWVEASEEK